MIACCCCSQYSGLHLTQFSPWEQLRLAEEAAEVAEKAEADIREQLGAAARGQVKPYSCGAGLAASLLGIVIFILWLQYAPQLPFTIEFVD